MRTISRADNHSAVAAAAYRSGSVLKDERTGQRLKTLSEKTSLPARVLSLSVSPLAITHSTKPIQAILKGDDFRKPEKSFAAAATTPAKDNAARAVWHKEVTIKIQSLDQTRAERAPITVKEPMDSSKVWKVEANEKGKIILERMQADIRERKAEMPRTNPDGFSGRFNNPSKSATDEAAIQKVRTEAKATRAKVPPDMRAEPYSNESSKSPKQESGFSNKFKSAGQTAAEDSKPKMSSAFNTASKARMSEGGPKPSSPHMK